MNTCSILGLEQNFTTLLKRCLLIVVATFVLGYSLLWMAASLPKESLKAHVEAAASEGYLVNYPRLLAFRNLDMYTECVGLGIGIGLRPELSDLVSMKTYGECEALRHAVEQDFPPTMGLYPRYIHGYQALLLPLYTALPMPQARLTLTGISVVLSLSLCAALVWRTGLWAGGLMAVSFLFATTHHVFLLATHAASFWVVLIGGIAVVLSRKRQPLVLFALIGSSDTFLTFLNMGSLSLALPLFCYVLTRYYDQEPASRIVLDSFWCAVSWSLAFFVGWLFKWGVAWAVLPSGSDLFGATLAQYPARNFAMIGSAAFNNFKSTAWQLWLIIFAFLGFRLWKYRIPVPKRSWCFLFPAVIPLIWMCLLPGQSGVRHSFFVTIITWPTLAAALFVLAAHPRTPS